MSVLRVMRLVAQPYNIHDPFASCTMYDFPIRGTVDGGRMSSI